MVQFVVFTMNLPLNLSIDFLVHIGRFYKLINSSGSRSARLNLSESVAHPRTSAINSVRLSTH